MGEAKKRRLARTTRMDTGVAAEDFICPDGYLTVTFDVMGRQPTSVMIMTDRIAHIVAGFDRSEKIEPPDIADMTEAIAREYMRAKDTGDDEPFEWITMGALYLAISLPKFGDEFRSVISQQIGEYNRCHISWGFNEQGHGIIIADKFVPVGDIIAQAPKGSGGISYKNPLYEKRATQH